MPASSADEQVSTRVESRLSSAQVLGFLALSFFVMFPGVLMGTQTFFYRDYGVLAYPTVYHQQASFWKGELPLWNPYSNCGAPFLAQWGTMALYPFSLFYLLLPLPWSLNVFCLAHLVWAGFGMFQLARRWLGLGPGAALAGLSFVFNGISLSSLMWPNYTVALGWMPWVVLLAERVRLEQSTRPLIVAAIVASLQMLSGVPEIILLTWLIILGLLVLDPTWKNTAAAAERPAVSPGRMAGRMLLLIGLVSGLVAIQLLPFLDLLIASQRHAGTATAKWAMPPWGWGNLFIPMFRCAETPQGMFIQLGQDFFASSYLGVIVLALAGVSLWIGRRARVWLLAMLAALGLLLALGEHGLLYRAVRYALPSLGFVRYPIKFMVLPAFTLPLLAGFGLTAFLQESSESRKRFYRPLLVSGALVASGIGLTLTFARMHPTSYDQWPVVWASAGWRALFLTGSLVILFFWPQTRSLRSTFPYTAALSVLVILDALVGVPSKNPVLPKAVLAPGLWELENKRTPPRLGEGRFLISPEAEQHLLVSHVKDQQSDLIGKRLALWSHLNLVEQTPKVNGSSTLQVRQQKDVENLLYSPTNLPAPGLIRFLNAVYVTSPGKVVEWSPATNALPFITAGQKPVLAGPAETLTRLADPAFDPAHVVYLPLEAAGVVPAEEASVQITQTDVAAHKIRCAVRADRPSVLTVAQTFYHPWRALVDGKPTALWRANYAFQAIAIPAGEHSVLLTYQDSMFRAGAAVSGTSLLLCSGLWFRSRRQKPSGASG